ncbi:MAG TPA: hypothetical protein VFP61_07590 [Acidimicrobiales bacterium]|nr:hypothetical protein [Acidimicrobiales bacterium]
MNGGQVNPAHVQAATLLNAMRTAHRSDARTETLQQQAAPIAWLDLADPQTGISRPQLFYPAFGSGPGNYPTIMTKG